MNAEEVRVVAYFSDNVPNAREGFQKGHENNRVLSIFEMAISSGCYRYIKCVGSTIIL
jgi:hypothetical protein